MFEDFKTMNVDNQVRLLLGQWLHLELKILGIKHKHADKVILQERFKQIYKPILGVSYQYYNLESLIYETSVQVSLSRGVTIEDQANCLGSVSNYPIREVIIDLAYEDDEEFQD